VSEDDRCAPPPRSLALIGAEIRRLRDRFGSPDPARVADVLQTLKTALAGTVAWVVATDLLHLEQAFLAPWAAVLVVHSTIHRTLARGAQQVSATFLGVFLAWLAGQLFGLGALAMGTMLLVAFGVGRLRWWRDEAMTVGTTGIVVLATDAVAQTNVLAGRLLDTSVGVAVGLAVNLVVWPPLRDRAAWSRLDQLPLDLCEVLDELASGLRPELSPEEAEQWVVRLRAVDVRVDEAWGLVRQARESSRLNPRRSRPAGLEQMDDVLHLLEQAVADVLSMARTVVTSAEHRTAWDPRFRQEWARLVTETSAAVRRHDAATLQQLPGQMSELVAQLSDEALVRSAWQEYGGLLVNLRNVVQALGQVTEWGNRSGPSTRRRARYRVPGRLPEGLRPAPGRGLSGDTQGYPPRDDR
jgi:uncharacterized membrane protein YccC